MQKEKPRKREKILKMLIGVKPDQKEKASLSSKTSRKIAGDKNKLSQAI